MSGTRPPNKDNSADEPSNASDNSPIEKDESQKKQKLDQPSSQPSTPSASSIPTRQPSLPLTPPSSNNPSARASSFSFIPRPVLAKHKSVVPTSGNSSPSESPSTASSNRLISSMLSSASAAAQPISSTIVTAVAPKSSGYIQLENELAKIGDIANHIALLAKNVSKTDEDIYAVSYGLVLMAERLDYIKQFHSSAYNNHLSQLGIDYKFPPRDVYSLGNTFEAISYIRNVLADHFVRTSATQLIELHTLFNLGDDIAKLAALNKKHEDTENPFRNKSVPWLIAMADTFKEVGIEKKTVSYDGRINRIISALQQVQSIKSTGTGLTSVQPIFAASMLFVIAGTCARDISRSKDPRLSTFFKTPDGRPIQKELEGLVGVRDALAHNLNFSATETLRERLQKTNEENFLSKIRSHEPALNSVLNTQVDAEAKPANVTTPRIGK